MIKKDAPQEILVVMVLWMALLMSHLIIFGVSYFVIFDKNFGATPNEFILAFLGGVSLLVGLFSQLIYSQANRIVQEKSIAYAERVKRSFTLYVLCWALGESITIFGLVYGILVEPQVRIYAYVFFLAGIFLHIAHRPRLEN